MRHRHPGALLMLVVWAVCLWACYGHCHAQTTEPGPAVSPDAAAPGETAEPAAGSSPGSPVTPPGPPAASGTPGPGPAAPATTAGAAPGASPAATAEEDPNRLRLKADRVRVDDTGTTGEGSVQVSSSEFTASADQVFLDADQVWLTFRGHVEIGTSQMKTTATSLQINLETSKWRVTGARTEVLPEFFGRDVQGPIYVQGQTIRSAPASDDIEAFFGSATTCDLSRPHYALRSSYIRALPGKKVRFRRPALYLFGSRVVRFPVDFTLRLDGRQNQFIPEVGQNEVEGYYAKFRFPYGGETSSGLLRLQQTQKRGTGLGVQHELLGGQQYASLSVFWEPSEGALSSDINHRYDFSPNLSSALNASLQRNSGYFGDSQNLTGDLTFRRTFQGGQSQLGLQRSASRSGSYSSRLYSVALTHDQRSSPNTSWSARATMRGSSYQANQPTDRELETSFDYRDSGRRRYSLQVVANKRYDLDGSDYTGDSSYRVLNRIPEITIATDTDRLDSWRLFGRLFTSAQLALGHFQQQPDNLSVSRAAFKFELGGSERRLSSSVRARTSARYYQSFYDDGSAQYLLGASMDVRQQIGSHWTNRINYEHSKPSGYSPIRLDYWGNRQDLVYQGVGVWGDNLRVNLSSGYDFVQNRWRTVWGQFQILTSPNSRLQIQTGYDLDTAKWRPLNAQWAFVHPDLLQVNLGAQYDLDQGRLWQSTLGLDWFVDRKTRIEFQGRYSGYTHRLDQMDIRLSRDLHCWVGSISYSKLTGDFQINLGLKAFPAIQVNFGSARGPAYQSGGGVYY